MKVNKNSQLFELIAFFLSIGFTILIILFLPLNEILTILLLQGFVIFVKKDNSKSYELIIYLKDGIILVKRYL